MNRQLELLLQLQELTLLRKAQEVVQTASRAADFDWLDQKINRLRHKLPGPVLSQFDALQRQSPDAVVQLSDGMCLGCHQELSSSLAARIRQSRDLVRCGHCGRFLFSEQQVPPYVELK
jgi:predicted  nucleic acid-binding Zn-ribbon protein